MSVIRARNQIGRIHIVEHDLIGSELKSHGSDKWVTILVKIDPLERTIRRGILDELGVMHFLYHKERREIWLL